LGGARARCDRPLNSDPEPTSRPAGGATSLGPAGRDAHPSGDELPNSPPQESHRKPIVSI
jgi:hypothetical protein